MKYNKEQLCYFFGVSIVTLNTWIYENRFINPNGVFEDNSFWISRTGKVLTIKEIKDSYEKESKL